MKAEDLSALLRVAYDVLQDLKGKQGHVNEIADRAAQKNSNMGMAAADFALKLSSELARHVKRDGALFAKVAGKKDADGKVISYKRGVYRIKQIRAPSPGAPIIPPIEPAYLGKAGELAVMGELLFWGFNPSLMAVDQGIDIVASKNGCYYHLQVKTSSLRPDGRFGFTIKTSAFDSNHSNSTFYVFVLRNGTSNTYVVIPSSHLSILRNKGIIRDSETSLSITISVEEKGKLYRLNNKENVGMFINDFGLIC